MPADVVAKLSTDIAAVAGMPEVKKKLAPLAAVTIGSTAPEFSTFIRAEYDRWSRLIKESGVKPS